ncbi:MAG: cupin domain-containing protein [Sphaerochaeta sp.]|jgi:quercetin dioxygenase-like cupin family protein|uniref:cupin domain-containing protein n=1 Tax=unclassified Sphaerochaeta TaxID=2637943 RepID=UPI000E948DF9|nr:MULTISPECIES: cupin domain-containing protein [unclassified Sphaerochaeta]MDX9825206.1 cupin domain-containing protein [Sphaerochaeta sp.]MEA4866799.1 cupin domain-containing protein [Sphaerochaeta sp.]HBO36607.1 cupin domain-containing protein [Sphaerochaeta sp.]HCU30700.1 cupin domain-containing protein [Sphaerochaeta sp.]HPE93110.1 cupin domain-containing protein [Sphaerochaeta sp.]
MIKREQEMKSVVKQRMREGTGQVVVKSLMDEGTVSHSRLFAELTIEKGCSIGVHNHVNETEYYWITEGKGIVTEADGEKVVQKGDLVITGGGASHAIRNDEDETLKLMALIILE